MSFSEEPSTRPDPDKSLPEDMLEHGLRAALNADDDFLEPPSGVLDALERLGGRPSRVFLGEPGREDPGPVIAPAAPADQRLSRGKGQYRVDGELARGGMGVVLKGHDTDLGRDVALKVMHPEFCSRPESVQRFVEEAQIGGQLQHPGIVPVYELGLMADERPYFAMKLIKGRTLGSLFADRESPDSDQRRFLGIFEQVCQTVAYAHARGVIHRDLKPSNIMVGAFGEVQVVDWGLAKVLQRGGVADEKRAQSAQVSVIETVRSEHGSSHSRVGSVMGTPAYMAPEQARGEVTEVTERADVFSLGAILCELLTGAPPYTGDRDAVMMQAAAAELTDAKQRLNDSNADEELISLALRCLAPAPSARPHNAEAVAKSVQAHLSSVEERAREARLEAERAGARATAERKARKLTAALGTTVLIAILGGGGGYVFVESQRQARRERVMGLVNEAITESTSLRAQGSYAASLAAARQAEALAQPDDVEDGLRARVTNLTRAVEEEARREKEQLARDEHNAAFLAHLDRVRSLGRNEFIDAKLIGFSDHLPEESPESRWERHDDAYGQAFLQAGIDVWNGTWAETADQIQATGIPADIGLRLDDWARVLRKLEGRDSARALRLLEIAHQADAEPFRERIRAAIALDEVEALRELVEILDPEGTHPTSLVVLAGGLADLGAVEEGAAVLERAQRSHPDDYNINLGLVALFARLSPPRYEQAVRFALAAVATKPDGYLGWGNLGHILFHLGEYDGAATALERAVDIDSENASTHRQLGVSLWMEERFDEGIDAMQESARRDSSVANRRSHFLLVWMLVHFERHEEALSVSLRFLNSHPDDPLAHSAAAELHVMTGRVTEALEFARRAVELDGNDGHTRLQLAKCLRLAGRLDEAASELILSIPLVESGGCDADCLSREATVLGVTYHQGGRTAEGARWGEEALRVLQVDHPLPHVNLGVFYNALGKYEAARSEAQRALVLRPDFPFALSLQAQILANTGDFTEALAVSRQAIVAASGFVVDQGDGWGLTVEQLETCVGEANSVSALALRASGDHAAGIAAAEEALRHAPTDTNANLIVVEGRVLFPFSPTHDPRLGMKLAYDALANESLDIATQRGLLNALGLACIQLREWSEGVEALEGSIALPEGDRNRAYPWLLLVACWTGLDELDLARACYTHAEEARPSDKDDPGLTITKNGIRVLLGDAENSRAWSLLTAEDPERRDPERALELARGAVELQPRDESVLNTLGVALYVTGHYAESIAALEKSEELNGSDTWAENGFFLAMALHRTGEAEKALALFNDTRSLPPPSADEAAYTQEIEAEARALLGLEKEDGE